VQDVPGGLCAGASRAHHPGAAKFISTPKETDPADTNPGIKANFGFICPSR